MPDQRTRSFSPSNALWLGQASKIAYGNQEEATPRFAELGLTEMHFYSASSCAIDTQAYLVGNDECLVLSFRGTEPKNIKDWMTDLDVALVGGPGGKVHDGFNAALNSVWRELWRDIVQIRQGRALWVTGHSLGGALAVLATAKLRLEKDEPVNGLYTFGQPRVGDRDFARSFDTDFGASTFRYVNNNDLVPRVPFRTLGYSHVGASHYFGKDGRERPDIDWMDLIADRLRGRIEEHLVGDGIKDHSMDRYLACLMENYGQNLPALA